MVNDFVLSELPPNLELETKAVLKQTVSAYRYLSELKGISKTIPNQGILINTLPLLEAKDSSAIENIITTHDELYKEGLFSDFYNHSAAKEVQNYSEALKTGFEKIKSFGLLTNNIIIEIQNKIEKNNAGFRKLPGTDLRNLHTGKLIYTPPQNNEDIVRLMRNLENFINDDQISDLDVLVKMAVIHYQFESIHPFYDGNGRTGRIINILFLVLKGLLDIPVLYLSRYIINSKTQYYQLIQDVREKNNWEEWILYILKGIESTAKETIEIIIKIRNLMQDYKIRIRQQHKFYSQDLLNNLFSHPYTKIDYLERDLKVHRQTASKYLNSLAETGFLECEKIGNQRFYINRPLFNLFLEM